MEREHEQGEQLNTLSASCPDCGEVFYVSYNPAKEDDRASARVGLELMLVGHKPKCPKQPDVPKAN